MKAMAAAASAGRSAARLAPGDGSVMRVLLVSEPGVDGVFRHVEGLAAYLIENGHEVHLAYSTVRGSDHLDRLTSAVSAAGGATLDLAVGNGPQWGDVRAFARLRRLVRRIRPDVIHAHSSKAGALVRALRVTGIREPIFYTPHAYFGMAGGSGPRARAFSTVERALGRIGITINLSEGERQFAINSLGVPADRLRQIPNPVDTRRFQPVDAEAKQRLKAELGIPRDALVLGSVGRLTFQKDPVTLYRAFAAARKRSPDLWLYHLGDGELSGVCERLAGELGIRGHLIRRPYLGEPVSFYRAVDGVILTSRYEGLSLALLEALACGLPIIVSEAPGNLDFVRLGLSHCWSAPVEAIDRFAEAITRWVDDVAVGRPSNHRQVVESRFGLKACYGALVKEYHSACAARTT